MHYVQRTEWNVRDTGGTVIFSLGPVLTGGSKKTVEFAVRLNKPCLHAHSGQEDVAQALKEAKVDLPSGRYMKNRSISTD
jgi:Circularly permutated YpsA SLOG family